MWKEGLRGMPYLATCFERLSWFTRLEIWSNLIVLLSLLLPADDLAAIRILDKVTRSETL